VQDSLWQAVLGEIELSVSRASFITWFKNTHLIRSKDNILVVGGERNGVQTTTTEYAPVNTDGSIGLWKNATPFPIFRTVSYLTTVNGYVFSIGGEISSITQGAVYSAKIQ